MFATLVGGYPRTPLPGAPFRLRAAYARLERGEVDPGELRRTQDELVRELLAEQMQAGLTPLTDGQVRWDDAQTAVASALSGFEIGGLLRYFDTNTYYRQPRAVALPSWRGPITVDDWQFAAAAAAELAVAAGAAAPPVKACLVGPYTLARLSDPGEVGREALTVALADALNQELRALRSAGAEHLQVDENAVTLIGDDPVEWRLALRAWRHLTAGIEGARVGLGVTMGAVHASGARALFDAPFSSYLFDLVAGPASWELVEQAPTGRAIVCGVADARTTRRDDEQVMRGAIDRAAAAGGRGRARVGIAPSASLEYLPRDRARAKIEHLGRVAREVH